ncbi:MAG: hypothetical protein OIF32_09480 [Campylobacterales bacterium]|nr:hypothetical protein [Campylobacterales bacterium]
MIQDILAKIDLHLQRAKSASLEIKDWQKDLNSNIFEDYEKVKTVDSFIYRFIKLQDLMGDKLFRILLDELGEYKDNMSLLDVLDKLEKLELIEDSSLWIEYRKLRNKLTHEYPNNEDEIIEGIKLSIEAFEGLEKILDTIRRYVSTKNL